MSDETNTLADDEELPESPDEAAEDVSETDEDKPLGPQGEKALYAEKERRKAADRERRTLARKNETFVARIAELEALASKGRDEGDEEIDLDAIRQEERESGKAEARAEVRAELVGAKIAVLAAKKFKDADDAIAHLNRAHELDDFLDDDGQIDDEAIDEALDELLKKKPHLAASAQGGKRFAGSGDGGAKPSKPARPKSLGDAVTRHYNR